MNLKIFKQQANICRVLCRKWSLTQTLYVSIMSKEPKAGKCTKKTAQQSITAMVFWIRQTSGVILVQPPAPTRATIKIWSGLARS